MLVGYARVSTIDQNLDLQRDALKEAGCERIFTDIASGIQDSRQGLSEALNYLRSENTLVVWKLDGCVAKIFGNNIGSGISICSTATLVFF